MPFSSATFTFFLPVLSSSDFSLFLSEAFYWNPVLIWPTAFLFIVNVFAAFPLSKKRRSALRRRWSVAAIRRRWGVAA